MTLPERSTDPELRLLRVLLIEDRQDDALLVLRELEKGGFAPSFRRVASREEIEDALDAEEWDVVLCDHTLPGMRSYDALELFRQRGLDIPFIVVSGTITEDLALKAMRGGASDFVLKSRLGRLVPAVQRELRELEERRARHRAERELVESERRFGRAFRDAPIGMALVGPDRRFRMVNRAWCEMLGYTEEEALGLTTREITHPEDLRTREDDGAPPAGSGDDAPGPVPEWVERKKRYLRKDGETIWARAAVSAVRDDRGELLYWIVQARDITDEKRSSEALAERTAFIEKLIASSPATIFRLDARDLSFSYMSPQVERLTGYPAEAFLAGPGFWMAHMHPMDLEPAVAEMRRAAEDGGERIGREYRFLHADGSYRWFQAAAVAERDEKGETAAYVGYILDITERKRFEREVERLSLHDPLTGLSNRRLFDNRLEHALKRAGREGHQVAVLCLDLDRFRLVNDGLGHASGDELLRRVARRLRRALRAEDTLARLGSDEFGVLMERVGDRREAERAAARLGQALERPFEIGGMEVRVTASVGVALGSSTLIGSADLLRFGDVALDRAKKSETSCHVFEPEADRGVTERLHLENQIRTAVREDQLAVHYQPIVRLEDGAIVGLEALVRWEHPERGLVGPAAFIPVAEETDLILEVDSWVKRRATRDVPRWNRLHRPRTPLYVSLNLSARHFQRPDLPERLRRSVEDAGLCPTCLQVEITEHTAMQGQGRLGELRQLGVNVALDDIGTGFSSLEYLTQLDVDSLKVDRAFVAGLGGNARDRAIVEAVLLLGDRLGLEVVAEGIETEEQLGILRELGCERGQGYHFHRPLPAAGIEELLAGGLPATA